MLNLIEPDRLIRHFIEHPPVGFAAGVCEAGVPFFSMRLDILTTAGEASRTRVKSLPLYRFWGRWLSVPALFVGTTVSEYILFPNEPSPQRLVGRLLHFYGAGHPLTILKDIPVQSALLDPAANQYAQELAEACRSRGCILVSGQALAYVPIDFDSTEEYLGRLSPGQRKDFRRKLRVRSELTVETVLTGSEALREPLVLSELYELYLNVYRQSHVHFERLSRGFFASVLQDRECGGVVFLYRHRGQLVGYNICFVHEGRLIDKFIGLRYPQARDLNIYFVSWFHNLEYALEHGLKIYVAGWTDPEVKRTLGAQFTWTRHAVYPRSRMLRSILPLFRRAFERDDHWGRSLQ